MKNNGKGIWNMKKKEWFRSSERKSGIEVLLGVMGSIKVCLNIKPEQIKIRWQLEDTF